MKIGFIGLGNMASAIIGGLLAEGATAPADIIGSAKTEATRAVKAAELGITATASNREVAEQADVLVLAVKPVFLGEVIEEVRDAVDDATLVVSIAAGKTIEDIAAAFGKSLRLVRCMPNTPALVGAGCTAICEGPLASEDDLALCERIMGTCGATVRVPERLMDAASAASGSSPAFVFMFIEALADGAVEAGIPRAQAYAFAAQATLGSAKLMLETGQHPGALKDMVCSPGGTTIEGVKALEEGGMRAALMNAIDACVQKAKAL